ncbi:D-alanyl-D-alanine carboxypeptidase/D-alanyl-D-alanine endopeptidase [Plebeiibacterium marinum]|uniref:D-alanyl-D-alanine carboxypeptidase/D-alanyl-D-alanine-endopeptidase n=1 Tax=Plebeiibacterium marinum TaxID=2992111 RepID=A0AAE3SJ01_9BACT|nr:D-alanyl-D-alanine carboxypeptidase/D-alanyl-D-alanine-endopeptidase [Plebeiobacterium marinum]MCW3804924.1 D-alanyl-D-alanine carboxypeptidase/D-alanyl-D-alanine-endopeptidase [Plebeiobacterium marinum]
MRYIFTFSIILFSTYIKAQYISDSGALFSGLVYNLSNTDTVFAYHEEKKLIPASLTKIVTTATALEVLGADFQFETKVCYSGTVSNHVLYGDIVIKACGDPTLGSKYFEETKPSCFFEALSKGLQKEGITRIEGIIRVESSSPGYSSPRLWEDIGNYYGGFPHGFNWRDNTVNVVLSSSAVGETCVVKSVDPDIYPYALQCDVVAASHSKDSAYVYGVPEINKWWIEGSIPSHRSAFKIKAAMPDPQRVFAREFSEYLIHHGIEIANEMLVDFKAQEEETDLFSYFSPDLSEIIRITNQKSNNLFADALFLVLAKEYTGKASWDNGILAIRGFWKDKIEFDQYFRLRDGSGLTPKNLISPKGMVQLLSWMKRESVCFEVFKASLAVGGVNGTLKSVFKHPDLQGKIIGKSGSMEGVLGYCGYATLASDEVCSFCVLANNYLVETKIIRGELDDLVTRILIK